MATEQAFLSSDDARFASFFLAGATLERIAEGFIWAEGPVWFDEIAELRFSDIPNNRMMAWSEQAGLRVFRQPAQWTNGHTRDRTGAMISCEHGGRCISRTTMDGGYEVLATHWRGKRLNSPNDVVVKSDGSIWFTDPPYGIVSDHEGIRAESEIGGNHVYRIDPARGAVERVADDFDRPNGLAFSPDETTLYIADSGRAMGHGFGSDDRRPHHVRALEVVDGCRLGASRVVADIDRVPDGLRVDTEGLLWVSAADGIHCLTPSGARLGRILVPEVVANLTFGGPGRSRLFICATSAIYAVDTTRCGAQIS
ncbi:SMP-30/gluconolactonase/LRE family protein [Aurantimonas sp. C2-6-R+9]|uniref:SMP-30/gluconolactonase/LRE family protein n=1 Tax=unclassified Aurantimonas TaxID=2638230 RepID=UPI002E19C178|nr:MULTISPECIES: SMP-30/gluconolactonase/LRE family protein [unclassified Aurantimonas]MEC5291851.1 SMP-30/gluconolactonase/LRE family protein [Aurantimonas sp. C2-3-R2]MEC5381996.1 SMP-30/gluconolactonase/LRE family protein [Aurantimonas sp. C2-6-R+9]MEC5412933.1 SMP-30/gluconolactonase/LRE family protein [Aurantimonas sp. C2-4-R8]